MVWVILSLVSVLLSVFFWFSYRCSKLEADYKHLKDIYTTTIRGERVRENQLLATIHARQVKVQRMVLIATDSMSSGKRISDKLRNEAFEPFEYESSVPTEQS